VPRNGLVSCLPGVAIEKPRGELTDDQAVLISDILTGSFGTDIAERKLAIIGLSGGNPVETVVWATYGINMERHDPAVKAAQKHGEVKEREEHPARRLAEAADAPS
jgi:hypothetical protein